MAEAYHRIPDPMGYNAMKYVPEKIAEVVTLFRKKYATQIDDASYFAQIRITPEED